MVSTELMVTVAFGLNVMSAVSLDEQPVIKSVTVTVYFVNPATAVTVGLAKVESFKFVFGDQLYL